MAFRAIRLQIPGESDGEVLYVSKRAFEGVVKNKKLEIKSIRPVGGKLVIEYVSTRSMAKGTMELNDLGPKNEKR